MPRLHHAPEYYVGQILDCLHIPSVEDSERARLVEIVREASERVAIADEVPSLDAVIVPARTVVHINGVPVYLAVDTIVETHYGNMRMLVGHHYAHLPSAPDRTMTVSPAPAPTETP